MGIKSASCHGTINANKKNVIFKSVDRWMDGWMDGWKNWMKKMNVWLDGWMNRQMDMQTDRVPETGLFVEAVTIYCAAVISSH